MRRAQAHKKADSIAVIASRFSRITVGGVEYTSLSVGGGQEAIGSARNRDPISQTRVEIPTVAQKCIHHARKPDALMKELPTLNALASVLAADAMCSAPF